MFKIVLGFMIVLTLDASEISQAAKDELSIAFSMPFYRDDCIERKNKASCKIYEPRVIEPCEKNGLLCFYAGLIFFNGTVISEINYFTSKKYFEQACYEKREGMACLHLGAQYGDGLGVRKDIKHAKELFGVACDLGVQLGCELYAKHK